MAQIELKEVAKRHGPVEVLRNINLEIQDGEFIVLVGPSGCGKSSLLRMMAALEPITAGEFLIDGERMNDVRPHDRDIAMVFQSYALYPHMDVARNMGFSMEIRKDPVDLYERPANKSVAQFIGSPTMNVVPVIGGEHRVILKNVQALRFLI